MSNDMIDERTTRKRVITLGIVIVVIAGLILAGAFYYANASEKKQDTIKSDVQVSETDRATVKGLATTEMDALANFGVLEANLTPENILNVQQIVATDSNGSSTFWKARRDALAAVKDDVFPGGPLSYDDREIAQLVNPHDVSLLATYKLESASAEPAPKGGVIGEGNEQLTSLNVKVDYIVKVTHREMNVVGGNHSDGNFNVKEKSFTDSATFTYVQDKNMKWKLYSIQGNQYPFLLASWSSPASSTFDDAQTNGFSQVGKIETNANRDPNGLE